MTVAYEIEIVGLEEQLDRFKRFAPIADPILSTSMTRSTILLRNNIVPRVPVFTGRLRNSMASEVKHLGPLSIVGKVGSTLRDEIYPEVMEFGRKPGKMPPPQALERWVHLKLGVPVDDAPGVAYNVARRIGARGIKPKRFMQRGWAASVQAIQREFAFALERIAEALSNGRN